MTATILEYMLCLVFSLQKYCANDNLFRYKGTIIMLFRGVTTHMHANQNQELKLKIQKIQILVVLLREMQMRVRCDPV